MPKFSFDSDNVDLFLVPLLYFVIWEIDGVYGILLQKCSPQWPILKKTACLIFTTIEDWTDSMLTNYLEEGGREIEKKGTCTFCPYGACLVLISQTESG